MPCALRRCVIPGNVCQVEELWIDLGERTVRTRDCPLCMEPEFFVAGIVRKDRRADFSYDAWVHACRDHGFQALVDVALGMVELGDAGEMDGPDGYSVVFSCYVANGQLAVIDAPAVADEDPGWRSNLQRDEARAHDRYGEWREVLAFILDVEPLLRRMRLCGP